MAVWRIFSHCAGRARPNYGSINGCSIMHVASLETLGSANRPSGLTLADINKTTGGNPYDIAVRVVVQ